MQKHICKNILETGKPSKTTDKQISDYVLKRGKHKPRGIINAESVNQKLSKITFSPFVRDKEERIRLFQSAYESIIREHRIKISDSYAIKCLLSKVKPESTQHKMRMCDDHMYAHIYLLLLYTTPASHLSYNDEHPCNWPSA